jgi:hypothetical protein
MEPFYKNSEDYGKFMQQQCAEEKMILEKMGLKKN